MTSTRDKNANRVPYVSYLRNYIYILMNINIYYYYYYIIYIIILIYHILYT